MENLFLRVFVVSAAVSLVLLPLLLLRGRLEKRYAPQTRWGLWLAVALVLLAAPWVPKPQAPVVVEVPAYRVALPDPVGRKPITNLPQNAPAGNQGQIIPIQGNQVAPVGDQDPVQGADQIQPPALFQPGNVTSAVTQPETISSEGKGVSLPTAVSLTALLAGLWLLGTVTILLGQGLRYLLVRRRFLKGASPVTGLDGYALELGLFEVDFYQCKTISGPMTLGLFHPVVLLPEEGTAPAALRHELYHIKRRDVAYKALLLLTCALHWFNPLVWRMARQADRDVEACCDAAVVAGQDRGYRRAYGELLLTSAAGERATPFTTHFGGGKEQMKSRLTQLFRPGKRSRALVCCLLAAALLLSSLVACQKAPTEAVTDGIYCAALGDFSWPVGEQNAEGEDYGSIRLALRTYEGEQGPGKVLGEYTLPLAEDLMLCQPWWEEDRSAGEKGTEQWREAVRDLLDWPVRRDSIPAGMDYLVVTVKDGAITRLSWALVSRDDTLYLNNEYGFSLQLPADWGGKYVVEQRSDQYGTFWYFYERSSYEAKPGEGWGTLFIIELQNRWEYTGETLKAGVSDGWGILGVRGTQVFRMTQPTDVTWLPETAESYHAMEAEIGTIRSKDFQFFDPTPQVQHLTTNTMPTLDYYDPERGFLLYHTPETAYFYYEKERECIPFYPDQVNGSRVLGRCDVSEDGKLVYLSEVLREGGADERFCAWDIGEKRIIDLDSAPASVNHMTQASQEELYYTGFRYDMPLLSNVVKIADGTLVGLWIDYLMGDTIEYLRLIKLTDSGWEEERPFLTPELIQAPRDYAEPDWGFTLHLPEEMEGQYVVSKAANWWGFYEKEAYGSGRGFLMGFWAEDSGIYEQSAQAGKVLAVKGGITYAMDFSSPEDAEGITDEKVHQKVLDLLSALEGEMDESSLDLSGATRSSGYLWPLPYIDYGSNVILRPYEEGGYNVMDIYATDAVTVQCVADGVVRAASQGLDGNQILVEHGDGTFAWYGHMEFTTVNTGDHVTRGMILGYAGEENGRCWLSFGRMEGESWDTAQFVDPFGDLAVDPVTYRTYDFQTVSRDTVTFAGDPEIKEAFRKVLENVTDFWDMERQQWRSVEGLSEDNATVTVERYAVVDMDNDAIPEVVLWLSRDGNEYSMGGIVLRYEKAYVSGYSMAYRSMNLETLKTDGTFTWADSAAFSGTGRLDFRWGGTVEKINWMDMTSGDYESKYFVDSYAATQEEWENASRVQERKQSVTWYDLADVGAAALS
ncbi:MAG: peptidoglycan DD-metalloendopeptidase family protein [Oscillospiraceae bacterium]|nr:peptidoglycan DD-metalloendopeptidase family protein [Oscillospiraceae bacterium]